MIIIQGILSRSKSLKKVAVEADIEMIIIVCSKLDLIFMI